MRTSQILRRASIAQTCADAMIGAVAGLALYSSFPPLGWWWMSIPALALFISRIDEARAPRALGVTLSFGMSMWLPLIDWIPMAVGTRAAWFVLAFVQTLFLCAWVVFVRWTSLWRAARSPLAQALLYAISWAGVDAAGRGRASRGVRWPYLRWIPRSGISRPSAGRASLRPPSFLSPFSCAGRAPGEMGRLPLSTVSHGHSWR